MEIELVLQEHTKQDRESFEKLSEELSALRAELVEIKLALQSQKGFFAGIVFAVSAVVGGLLLAIQWFKN